MTTKELIKAEIDSVPEEDLEELYTLVKNFVEAKSGGKSESIMAKLRSIKIHALKTSLPTWTST